VIVDLPCPTALALAEGWRACPLSPLYEVHWDGRIRNRRTKLVLTPQQAKGGRYRKVTVHGTGVRGGTQIQVHQLVAETWHGARPSKSHVVDHVDNDSTRNVVTNLHWCTYSMNTRNWYAWQQRLQRAGEQQGDHHTQQIDPDEWDTILTQLHEQGW
jgi:hypothetical protein